MNLTRVNARLLISVIARRLICFAGLEVAGLGQLISFETQFTVNRRDLGVLGTRWSGGKAILGDEVDVRRTGCEESELMLFPTHHTPEEAPPGLSRV